MDKNELKNYASVDDISLEKTIGGHRHSKYYTAGHYVSKAVHFGIDVAGLAIAAGLFYSNPKEK